MKKYQQGEIGELAIIRICHMTPGWHRVKVMSMRDLLSMIVECIMLILPVGMQVVNTEHGMPKGVNMWNYKRSLVGTMSRNFSKNGV